MAILSAFADEIDDDPKIQMDTMEPVGVKHIELRGAWGINVMKFTPEQRKELKRMFTDRGFAIACIGSPIGKVRMDEDFDRHFDDFRHSVDLAEEFDSGYVRIFSYYPPEGDDIANHRDAVIDLAQELSLNFPVLLGATSTQMELLGLGEAIPATVIVDPDGKIVKRFSGVIELEQLVTILDELLDRDEPVRRAALERGHGHEHDHHDQGGGASLVPS